MHVDSIGRNAVDHIFSSFFDPVHMGLYEEVHSFIDINETLEEQDFTSVHRIILGRSSRSLADELETHPDLIDRPDSLGRTPLYWAVWRDDMEAVKILLHHGANITAVAKDGDNIFHLIAMSRVGQEMFSLIKPNFSHIEYPINTLSNCLNAQNESGITPWLYTVQFNLGNLLNFFLDYELNLTTKAGVRKTLFQYAAKCAETQVLLLLASIDLDGVDLMVGSTYDSSAMEIVVARLSNDVYWIHAPDYSEEAAEALVRLVAHARTFEPRLPRLIYGVAQRGGGEGEGEEEEEEEEEEGEELEELPDYGLLFPDGHFKIYHGDAEWVVYDAEDELGKWIDLEDWLEEHGQLDMLEAWEMKSDVSDEACSGSEAKSEERIPEKEDDKEEEQEGETFFDAIESTSTSSHEF